MIYSKINLNISSNLFSPVLIYSGVQNKNLIWFLSLIHVEDPTESFWFKTADLKAFYLLNRFFLIFVLFPPKKGF